MASQNLKNQTKRLNGPLAFSAPNVRSCGCVRRYVSALPQQSLSAPVLARRRSRSSTCSSTKSLPRSRTPSNLSSGRSSTPSPVPKLSKAMSEGALLDEPHYSSERDKEPEKDHKPKYTTKCELKRITRPVHFCTTIFINLGSSAKLYLEQVKLEMQYIPEYQEQENITKETPKSQQQQFKTELNIMLERPTIDGQEASAA